ncbi:MAG: hypothetical protein JO225_03485 [Candidatus Eremiobacteraeota bacterium]|nr:hypothetical protein [Candidatus Eremiobacteraeota bacterium]
MIVTRRRRRRIHLGRYLLPVLALAALAFALTWPPSQRAIANGPLKPLWALGANVGSVVSKPFTFAAQQQTINERNRQIRDLNAQLEAQRKAKSDADTRTQAVQQQLNTLANQPRPTAVPAAKPQPSAAAGAFGGPAGTGAATTGVAPPTDDEKRLAATWAAMDPDKAAAVIQRLPDDEVVRVLAAMDSDSAGSIMNALPAAVAARISRAVAQVQPPSGR